MAKYRCQICKKHFSTPSGLTQHANAVHRGRKTVSQPTGHILQRSQQSQPIQRPEHDANLWSMPITRSSLPITLVERNETMTLPLNVEEEMTLSLDVEEEEMTLPMEVAEEVSEESSEELLLVDTDTSFDSEDLQGATLDDALETIEGKIEPEHLAQWPNDAYCDFMELVIEDNISNRVGDKMIKFFNKHSNLKESPLPKSTKSGKDYLNQIKSPLIKFKEKVVGTFSNVDFTLYYRPIFRAIQTLLQRPGITDNFNQQGVLRKEKMVSFNFLDTN